MWLFEYFFLNTINLICRSTDISKCFRGSLRFRDNESRLYIDVFADALGHRNKIFRSRQRLMAHPILQKKDPGTCIYMYMYVFSVIKVNEQRKLCLLYGIVWCSVFLRLKDKLFSFRNSLKDLDLSYKTDLDLLDCFGRILLKEKTPFYSWITWD